MGLVIVDEQFNDMINDVLGTIRPSNAQINTTADFNQDEPNVIKQFPQLDTVILASDKQQIKPLNIPGLDTNSLMDQGLFVHTTEQGVNYVVIIAADKQQINAYIENLLQWSNFKHIKESD